MYFFAVKRHSSTLDTLRILGKILNYLNSTGKYEIAEMGSYGQRNDPRAAQIPWKYYGVCSQLGL